MMQSHSSNQKKKTKTMNDTKLLPIKLRLKFYAYKYGLYGFILFAIWAFAFLLGKHIEATFIFATYCAVRYKFPTTFHHKNTYWCVFWSVLSFWICISVVIPIKYSIMASSVVALVLCFVLFKIQEAVDLRAELENKSKFSIYDCTYDEFASHCLKCGIRNDRVPYVWDIIRSDLSYQQLMDKYCLEYDSVKHDRYKFKKKLQKSLTND